MKRVLTVVVVLMSATVAFAAEQTHRYVVATKPHMGARQVTEVELGARDVQERSKLYAFVTALTDAEVAKMRQDKSVRYIESAEIQYHAIDDDGTTAHSVATE